MGGAWGWGQGTEPDGEQDGLIVLQYYGILQFLIFIFLQYCTYSSTVPVQYSSNTYSVPVLE